MIPPGPPRPAGLAQVNLARLRFPLDSAHLREFVAALDRINRLAERSPGFVWRHRTDDGHVSVADAAGDRLTIINLSVWLSYEQLHSFVYRSAHGRYLRRRSEWFDRIRAPATALWWVPAGHEPAPTEAFARLQHLRTYGPTPQAFSVRCRFGPSGRREDGRAAAGWPTCSW